MVLLDRVDELLEHIKMVETDTIELTRAAQVQVATFIESKGLVLDDETLEVMQYQDIISQQLSATIEAMESVQTGISGLEHSLSKEERAQALDVMSERLQSVLEHAKERHSAFSGKTADGSSDDGIEFF